MNNGRPPRNAISEGTTLAALERVPAWVDALWARAHRVDAGTVVASRAIVERFRTSLDCLGFAEIAREGIEEFAGIEDPADRARLRFHARALFGALGTLAAELAALAKELDLPLLEAALQPHRAALRRLEKLMAMGGVRPEDFLVTTPDEAARRPADDPDAAMLSEDGVGPGTGQKREWRPLPDFAREVLSDAANALHAAGAAVMAAVDGGAVVALDFRLERW